MDLKALYSMMSRKKFNYFDGSTNENNLYLSFSEKYGGRGNTIDIRIGRVDNDINCLIGTIPTQKKNISDNEVFLLIEEEC